MKSLNLNYRIIYLFICLKFNSLEYKRKYCVLTNQTKITGNYEGYRMKRRQKKKAPLPQKEKGMGGDVTKETSGVRTI